MRRFQRVSTIADKASKSEEARECRFSVLRRDDQVAEQAKPRTVFKKKSWLNLEKAGQIQQLALIFGL